MIDRYQLPSTQVREGLSRRRALCLFTSAALAVFVPVRAGDVRAGRRRKKKSGKPRIVRETRTISNNGQIAIPAATNASGPANPYPAVIEVSGFKKGKVTDVDLTLRDFSHGDIDNVEILLVKGNVNALVLGDISKDLTIPKVTITLDDEATVPLPRLEALTSGRFRPTNHITADDNFFTAPAPLPSGNTALSVFNGLDPNGEWKLFVVDDVLAVDGSMTGGWELTITANVEAKPKKKKARKL